MSFDNFLKSGFKPQKTLIFDTTLSTPTLIIKENFMFLYNVTVGIDRDIEQEWVQWMKEKHMPDVINTGMFISSRMYRVLHDNNDGTVSYSVQYLAGSLEHVVNYLEKFAPALFEEHKQKFTNKHVAFQTLLEEV